MFEWAPGHFELEKLGPEIQKVKKPWTKIYDELI